MKKVLYSNIHKMFSPDLMVRLNEITYEDETNEMRGKMVIDELRKDERFVRMGIKLLPLGSGTNRLGIQIGEYAYKFALDNHGKMDNRREFKYTDKLQPYVIKVYECTTDGLIMNCETYSPMSELEFREHKDEIIKILDKISNHFFIGDIGFDTKNYVNWGFRKSDKKVGILDFAYIYSVSYGLFRCTCENQSFLRYDENYVNLICPTCGRSWAFGQIRKRISKEQENAEIGDIRENNYVLTKESQVMDEHPEYTTSIYNTLKEEDQKRLEKEAVKMRNKEFRRQFKERKKHKFNEFELDDPMTFQELIDSLKNSNV